MAASDKFLVTDTCWFLLQRIMVSLKKIILAYKGEKLPDKMTPSEKA
jgi:hypothetical protein